MSPLESSLALLFGFELSPVFWSFLEPVVASEVLVRLLDSESSLGRVTNSLRGYGWCLPFPGVAAAAAAAATGHVVVA